MEVGQRDPATGAGAIPEAVEADPERGQKAPVIGDEIAEMEKGEAAEIDGVEFGEVRRMLKGAEKE